MSGAWGTGAEGAWAYRPVATVRLDDFRPLLPAEEEIVARLLSGSFDRLGDGSRPASADQAREVRAGFLRFLMLGGDEGCRPHEKGVRVSGAWITGMLDLEACRVPYDIGLIDCRFEAAPVLRAAIINRLFLDGSSLPGLQAERLEARGGVYLRGAELTEAVNIAQSRFGGNLECDGATIRTARGFALSAPSLEVRNVMLRGASLRGGINLAGATLEADLDCASAEVVQDDAAAIDASAAEVGGAVVLRNGHIEGEVRLVASLISGDMDCTGGSFSNADQIAIDISRTAIKGALFLRGDAAIEGTLVMTGASIGTIHDEPSSWPQKGELLLNRCRYGAFIDGPVDAESRLDWLARQAPERWGEDFWPQPYEHLAAVFREMGHGEDARKVLIVKEHLQRRARRRRASNPLWRATLSVVDGVLAITVAYGRHPLLALAWLVLFWAIGVGVFAHAEARGAFKPNSPVVLRAPEWTLCGLGQTEQRPLVSTRPLAADGLAKPGQSQLACFRQQWEASSYPAFNPWMYSLDTLLPVLDMGQKSFWRPESAERGGALALNYFYFQSVVGWALGLLAVAGFSGLVKSP